MVYKAEEPFLKNYDEQDMKDSPFDEWAETRFFK
jgi:hypothetical protein